MFLVTYIVRVRSDCKLLTLLNIFVFLMEMECVLCDVWIEFFLARSQNCEKRLLSSLCLSVCPSDYMEQLCFHCIDCHKIWYLRIFRKPLHRIQVSLKSDKNKGHFTWRPMNFLIISRSFLFRMRNVSDKSCIEKQNTHFVLSMLFSKIVPFVR